MKHRTDLEEVTLLPKALTFCQQRRVAIDGGANVGNWTDRLQQAFNTVIAIEPVESTFNRLKSRFEHSEKVRLIQMALWNEPAKHVHMRAPKKRTTSTAAFVSEEEKNSINQVWTTTIDMLGIYEVDLIKLDLEGAELRALMGGEQTLIRDKPVLIVEHVEKQMRRYNDGLVAMHTWLDKRDYVLRKTHGVNRIYAYRTR